LNKKPEKLIDKKGLRLDGRKADELRPVKIEVGILANADGSAYMEKTRFWLRHSVQERCIRNIYRVQTVW
jgi:exosome complex RNA-binding protein Rrp42 (RNase PH superfamily)